MSTQVYDHVDGVALLSPAPPAMRVLGRQRTKLSEDMSRSSVLEPYIPCSQAQSGLDLYLLGIAGRSKNLHRLPL